MTKITDELEKYPFVEGYINSYFKELIINFKKEEFEYEIEYLDSETSNFGVTETVTVKLTNGSILEIELFRHTMDGYTDSMNVIVNGDDDREIQLYSMSDESIKDVLNLLINN